MCCQVRLWRVDVLACAIRRITVPKEIFPSSYECDCGYVAHFFENTVKEVKKLIRHSNP